MRRMDKIDLIQNWPNRVQTSSFWGEWEKSYNDSFNWVEFDLISIAFTKCKFY